MQKRRSRIERPRDSSFDVRSPIRITSPKLSHRYGGACRRQGNFLDSSSLNEKSSLVALSMATPCERSNTRLASRGRKLSTERYYMERQTAPSPHYAGF